MKIIGTLVFDIPKFNSKVGHNAYKIKPKLVPYSSYIFHLYLYWFQNNSLKSAFNSTLNV